MKNQRKAVAFKKINARNLKMVEKEGAQTVLSQQYGERGYYSAAFIGFCERSASPTKKATHDDQYTNDIRPCEAMVRHLRCRLASDDLLGRPPLRTGPSMAIALDTIFWLRPAATFRDRLNIHRLACSL